ncbi:CBS domain-containing protein [Curtobacterium sp. Leaf261]|uniref:CBS domain-containing protein n=1 Tax=Curtobacterium sp. Leaf261 TaxID=1736311 RepID=UPI000A71DDC1|nr:CBS domain-containing protein [Curtobacterium sp. Leaf261]
MRASDIVTTLHVVERSTPAVDAIRLVAELDLVGLVVAEDDGHPSSVVASVDVMRLMLPGYLLDDLSLANTMDDTDLDDFRTRLEERTIGDVIDDDSVPVRDLLVVPPDAGLVEIAARMADRRTQLALVDDDSLDAPAFVTLPALLDAIVGRWDRPGGAGPGSAADGSER